MQTLQCHCEVSLWQFSDEISDSRHTVEVGPVDVNLGLDCPLIMDKFRFVQHFLGTSSSWLTSDTERGCQRG